MTGEENKSSVKCLCSGLSCRVFVTPRSMAYCHGGTVQVPVKIANTQRTPEECNRGGISLQSKVKADTLSSHLVSHPYHIASLKHGFNSLSWTRSRFVNLSSVGSLSKVKERMLCCLCELRGGKTPGQYLLIKCVWQVKKTPHLQASHKQHGSIYAILSGPLPGLCV